MGLQLEEQRDALPAQGGSIHYTWGLWWQQQVWREEAD